MSAIHDLDAAAETLGISGAELREERRDGAFIADVAEERNVMCRT